VSELGPFDRQVLFFGGKGGVGKTTFAAAFAVRAARAGHRTLLVSTDPAHSTSDVLEHPLGPEPRCVSEGLWALEIDPAVEADAYVAAARARMAGSIPPRLAGEVDRQLDIARLTPGAEEAALFDRFTRILDELGSTYDRVLFDTAPLGYTLRLLGLPESLTAWTESLIGRRRKVNALTAMWRRVAGSMPQGTGAVDPVLEVLAERRDRFARTRQLLLDTSRAGFVMVCMAEHLAVAETERAATILRRHGIPIAAGVSNRLRGGTEEARYNDRLRQAMDPQAVFMLEEQPFELRGVEVLGRVVDLLRPYPEATS